MDFTFEAARHVRDLAIRKSLHFGIQKKLEWQAFQVVLFELSLRFDELLNLLQEPEINLGDFMNAADGDAHLHRIVKHEYPIPGSMFELVKDGILICDALAVRAQAISTDLEGLGGLVQSLLEAASNAHHLAHGLHLQAQAAVCPFKLVEVPTGDLHDDIVQGGLEIRRGGLGDLVAQFIQGVADGELGGNFGDGVAGRFRGQGRRARNPRVDFDGDDVLGVVRAHRKLHVASSSEIANGPHHVNGHVAHLLVRRVAQGHRRGHRNGVARVNAHGVHVLNRTDNDDVVVLIA